MKGALTARLDRIASAIQSRPSSPPPTAEDSELSELMSTLTAHLQQPIPPALWHACINVLDRHMELGTPLAMPAEVEAYYRGVDRFTAPSNECVECGYALPATINRCPLCQGTVGWQRWTMKQSS